MQVIRTIILSAGMSFLTSGPLTAQGAELAAPQFYLAVNGTAMGPYGMDALRAQMAEGRLNPDTLVWLVGMADWQPAREVRALNPLFSGLALPAPATADLTSQVVGNWQASGTMISDDNIVENVRLVTQFGADGQYHERGIYEWAEDGQTLRDETEARGTYTATAQGQDTIRIHVIGTETITYAGSDEAPETLDLDFDFTLRLIGPGQMVDVDTGWQYQRQ